MDRPKLLENEMDLLETNSDIEKYKERYKDYRLKFEERDSDSVNPENDVVEVEMSTREGKKYYTVFATPKYIDWVLKKNKRTGECLGGSYFCVPNLILVRRLDEDTVRKTIEELIKNLEIHCYLRELD